ncbi:hypothetical protein [Pseudoclavibacter helvolus]|uniref:hypothetical protein n=1 Tax=Pseudoclavibacter helvolus TaxID=255205 RepID=UPI000838DCC0|nr:hypothetical protein [Pseudoclavibacter helvolus]
MTAINGPAKIDPADEQPDTLEAEIFFRRSFYSVVHDGVRLELSPAIIRVFYHADFDSELVTVKIPAVNDEGNVHTHLVYNSHGRAPLSPSVQLFELPNFLRQAVDRVRGALYAMRADAVQGKLPPPRVPLSLENPETYAVLVTAVEEYGMGLSGQADALPPDSHAALVMEESAARVDTFAGRLRRAA